MYFDELNISDDLLDALDAMNFEECTPIQEKAIPKILEGHDLMGIAQTGTGKTAAYLLPVLDELSHGNYPQDSVNCIIMAPTRELAQQIDQQVEGFGYYLDGVSSVAVYGGNDGIRFEQERKGLELGADIIIATPGRLISHLNGGHIDLKKVSFFILDEADRMLDMGFIDDIMKIVKELPDSCQRIMFSATMPPKIRELAVTLLHNPVEVKIAVSKPAEKIHQSAYVCYDPQKLKIIHHIFKQGDLKRVIIFSGKKDKVKDITRSLRKMNINCDQMHSDLSQQERDEVMYRFKAGQTDVLVATDIVARGIDIDDIQTVINYDVPHDAEDYVHRIGRTARADRDGEAITFVSEADIYRFQQIEHFLGKEVEKAPMPEGLGEAPVYTKREKKRSNTRRHGRWHSKGDGKNTQSKPASAEKTKNNKPHRRRPPKKDGEASSNKS